jgi:hypothetical protein
MNMRANFLSSFRRSEDSDDWNFGFFINLRRFDVVSKEGIELGGSRLVVIYAVQPDAENVHGEGK